MSNIEPVIPNLLSSTTAYTNKYAPATTQYTPRLLAPLQATNSAATLASTITPLQRFDLTRASRGQSPLTAKQSALALRTLATGKPATPPRRQSLLQSALSDARNLIGGIPKLPFALLKEARDLPDLPSELGEAQSANPLTTLGNLATVKGLRFVPGSFIASTLLGDKEHGGGQGVEGLRAHPLFTALDVLPAAEGLAKLTPASRLAKATRLADNEAIVAERVQAGMAPGTADIKPPHVQALRTALTRKVEAGQLVPNALGKTTGALTDTFYSTGPGRALEGAFKERATARIAERAGTFGSLSADTRVPTKLLRPNVPGGAAAMVDELAFRDVSADLQNRMREHGMAEPETYAAFTNPRLPDGTPTSPELMPDWTPEQRALAREYRDAQHLAADYTDAMGRDGTGSVSIDGTRETYDYARAQRLAKAQGASASAAELDAARQLVLDPSSIVSPRSVLDQIDRLDDRLAHGSISKATHNTLQRTYRAALEEAGWVADDTGKWTRVQRPTIPEITDALKPFRARPVVTRLIDHLANGRWSAASRDLAGLERSTVHVLPIDLPGFRAELSRLIQRDRVLARTEHITPRLMEQLTKQQARLESTSAPARFSDATGEVARDLTKTRARDIFSTDPNLDAYLSQIDAGIYDNIQAADPRFIRWVREDQAAARSTWKELRDAGLDPIFVSRVSPQKAATQQFVRMSDRPTGIQSTRARMMDASPAVPDVTVALNQQALDIVMRRANRAALDEIGNYGRKRSDLTAEFLPLAEQRFARHPEIPLRSHLDNVISQRWTKWNPGEFGGKHTAAFAIEGADDIYIPRVMHENVTRMFSAPMPKLTGFFDPIMKVFRMSVLPLALRWQLNNIISGGIIMAINDPLAFLELPGVVKALLAERRALRGEESATVRTAADLAHIEGAPPAGIGSMSPEMRSWDARVSASSPIRDRLGAAHNYALGRSLGTWMEQARAGRLAKIPDAFKRGVEASYDANQFVDDVVRGSLGKRAYAKALGKGASPELAEAMTVSTIRRVFQAWDEMTPIERSVMRSVIPFYGFAAYAVKFALRYPFDHPFRASVLNSIARAELQDGMTGLPEYIREMIFMGDPRANTHTRALNVAPFNPFGGVPSMFTLAGLLGQTNPVIVGALESVGVDVQQGGPMLYPEMRYDPETGRLVADPKGNIVSNTFGNITPQLQGIMSLLGRNEEYKDTLARDPAAAHRMLMSNFGLPILFRDINTGEQLIKSEMARYEDQELARKEALKTGKLDALNDFPGLRAYGDQIRALEASGALEPLRLPDPSTAAGKAYEAQVAALSG